MQKQSFFFQKVLDTIGTYQIVPHQVDFFRTGSQHRKY